MLLFQSLLLPFSNALIQIELYATNDELEYVKGRLYEIASNRKLFPQLNISYNIPAEKHENKIDALILELAKWLAKTSKGDFLYLKLTLELLEQGTLRLKSNHFKSVLPTNRWQVSCGK